MAIPLLLGVLFVVFILLHITPGDPAVTVAGPHASAAKLAKVTRELGLDRPFVVQYINYVIDAIRGNLGTSIQRGTPVTSVIGEGLPLSLTLIFLGSLFALVISIPLAYFASRYRDQVVDHGVRAYSTVTLTVPAFWVGIVLLTAVALPTGWFPVSGYGRTLFQHVRGLVLPITTLAIIQAPLLIRSLRVEFIRIRESDFMAMAAACGIGERRRALRHELPNAIIPAITLSAVSVSYLLFGIVVVENTFGLPGLGQTVVTAVNNEDFPVVQGVTLIFALITLASFLFADLLYALVDPRVELR